MAAVLVPGPAIPQVGGPHIDLLVHAAHFCLWSLALVYDFPQLHDRPWLIVVFAVTFGVFSEALQLLAIQRTFDLTDVCADGVGAVIAVVIVSWRHVVRRGP